MRKLKKLTARRAFNALKVYASYAASVLWGNTLRPAYPITLSVEPVAGCNLRCPQCPAGMKNLQRPEGQIDFELFKKIADEAGSYISAMILYFQGEPYMNKDFMKCIQYASLEKNIYTITSTNAHFLNENNARLTLEAGLDELIISLDGLTEKSYTSYRKGGNLKLVLLNIERFMAMRRKYDGPKPKVILQSLLLSTNLKEQTQLKQFAKDLGVDRFEAKTAQFYDFEGGNELMPKEERFSRYRLNEEGKPELKRRLRNRCKRLWETSVITWEGDVLPCCFDKDASHAFGNIADESFKVINNNRRARAFRKQVRNHREATEMCRNCTEP